MKKYIYLLSVLFVVASCNHKKDKTNPSGNHNASGGNTAAANDPLNFDNGVQKNKGNGSSPTLNTASRKIKKVSKGLNKKFQATIKLFYKASEKGWPKDECKKVAKAFLDLSKQSDGDKLATFPYNAGVAYFRCGMKSEAQDAFKKALKIDSSFPSAKMALAVMNNSSNPKAVFNEALNIMRDPFSLQDPDVMYNVALGYYMDYKRKGGKVLRKKLLDYLRRALSSIGKIKNDSIEAVRVRAQTYALTILFYLEAAKRKEVSLNLVDIFVRQAKEYILPCEGDGAIKDVYAKMALARYHNAYGLLSLYRNRIGRALDEFKKAKSCREDDFTANLNLGMLGIQAREPETAIKSLELVLSRYKSARESNDAQLALGVAYKVYAMMLQDMSEHQFENKERINMELERYKTFMKVLKEGLSVFDKILNGGNVRKLVPKLAKVWNLDPKGMIKALNGGQLTVKMIKDRVSKDKLRYENAVKTVLPKKIAKKEEELAKLSNVEKLRSDAKSYFMKSKRTYEAYVAKNPKDYKGLYDLATLYYKAGDLLGDMEGSYRKAHSLYKKILKLKSVSRKYRTLARKNAADVKSALMRLKEAKTQPAAKPAKPAKPAKGK